MLLPSIKQYVKVQRIPFLVGEKVEDWSREKVVKSILKLNDISPLNTLNSMRVNRHPLPDPVLSEFLGRPTSRKFLHHTACHLFGSWNSALRSSGLEPIRTSYNKFWTKTLIVESIKSLRRESYPLTVKSICRDRSRKTSKILLGITGKATTGSSLHDAARRYFGSWDIALERSGIEVESIKEKPFWTKKKIVRSIRILHKSGIPLNSERLGRDCGRTMATMIERGAGKRRVGRSLHGGAYRIFGSWERALHEAGINPLLHRKTKFGWNIRQVARIVNVLHYLEIPVNASSLIKDSSEQTKSIIFDCTGQKSGGSFLYRYGNQKLGSWDATLKYSGFMLSEIRRSGSPCERNYDKVIDIIRMFHKQDIKLNRSAMIANSNHLKFFVEQKFGPAVSGSSVVGAAQELFGSWDQALWEAGLDISAIRLKSRPHASSLPTISYQVEDVKRDGEFGLAKFLGDPSKSPEQILESEENTSRLQNAVDMVDEQEKELVDRIFDAILQIHHYKDQNQLIHFVAQHLDNEVSEEKVRAIFSKLATNLGNSEFN